MIAVSGACQNLGLINRCGLSRTEISIFTVVDKDSPARFLIFTEKDG
jgi:hypothetical protein